MSLDREIKVLAHPWQSHFSVQMFTKTIIQAKKRVFKSIKRNTYKANSPKRRDESEVSFLYTVKTTTKTKAPGADTVRLDADGQAEVLAKVVKDAPGVANTGRKLWTGPRHLSWYLADELSDADLRRYQRWMDAGMTGECPRLSAPKHRKRKAPVFRTGSTINRERKMLREDIINTYRSNDPATRFVTLNQSDQYATTSPAVTMNRVERWFDALADDGLALIAGDAKAERAQDGTLHVHAVVKVPDKALCLGHDGLNRKLLDAWKYCGDDQKVAREVFDVRGLAEYLTPLSAPGVTSGEVAPSEASLALAIADEARAKQKLKAMQDTTKVAKDKAKREAKRAHLRKKAELDKSFKKKDSHLVSVGIHGKSVVGKATPEVLKWLKIHATYLFSTQVEVLKVDDTTGEILGTVQVIVKDRYQLNKGAPANELVALLGGEIDESR